MERRNPIPRKEAGKLIFAKPSKAQTFNVDATEQDIFEYLVF
jgi:hypothetical protein